jgi:L-arabinose isomerase
MKPKIGLFLIGCERFRALGTDTARGDYAARKDRFAEQFVKNLGEMAAVVFPGIVYSRQDVEKAIDRFHGEHVQGVICSFLSWSEDSNWIRFLRDMYDVPLLYYHPALPDVSYDNTYAEDDFVQFLADGGLVGNLVGSGSIKRVGREAEVIVGDLDSARERIRSFIQAAQARDKLRRARFGLIATHNEIMWSTYIDPYNIFAKIGPELQFISYARLQQRIEAIPEAEAEAYRRELAERYVVEEDVREDLFLASARGSLALAALRDEFELDAVVLNDVSRELFETVGLRPGFYHPSFHAKGAVMVPEGDLGAATIVYALKQLTGRHVNFVEPFYTRTNHNVFSAGHAGPNDHTDPEHADLVRIARDVRFAKTDYKYAGAPFAWYRIPPGLKTLAHFSEMNGSYKIVCFTAESLPGKNGLCSYSHSDFKTERPVAEVFEEIMAVGTTQHFAVVDGDHRELLRIFAKVSGFEFYALQ